MVKISVIVPVYNVEQYLRTCFDSLVVQTFRDFEVIVVNDGTKDQSQIIIDDYVAKDLRFKSYIKENGGLSDARNYGIAKASGEYFFFLDSDDSLVEHALEFLYQKAIISESDLVICGYHELKATGIYDVIYPHELTAVSLKSHPEILNILPHCAWNKLYHKELFETIRFPKGLYFEDSGTSPLIYLKAKRISYLPLPLVNYLVDRPGNITTTVSPKILDVIDNLEIVNQFYIQEHVFKEYYKALRLFNIRLIYDNLWKLKYTKEKAFIKKMFDRCFAHLDVYFKDWRKDSYFKSHSLKEFIRNVIRRNKYLYELRLKKGE